MRLVAPITLVGLTALSVEIITTIAFSARKFVRSASMRCRTTASLQASATLRLAHAGASGQAHSPTLQGRALDRSGQNDVGCIVERSAHATVSDLGDATSDVGLARLVLLGGQPEMCSCRPRGPKAAGIVNGRGVGQRDDRADTGRRHQQPHAAILIRPHQEAAKAPTPDRSKTPATGFMAQRD